MESDASEVVVDQFAIGEKNEPIETKKINAFTYTYHVPLFIFVIIDKFYLLKNIRHYFLMATLVKDDELRSFDVPEVTRHAGGYTIYKIVLQVTPKEITENSYQVCK